jgi:hypothetical protein
MQLPQLDVVHPRTNAVTWEIEQAILARVEFELAGGCQMNTRNG